jgi:hypothetical protein
MNNCNEDYINILNDFKLKTFVKNQNDINMKLTNNINIISYNIEENNIELACRIHRKISNIVKNQNEFNMILINDINKLKNDIKAYESKINDINDIYDNIYYIFTSLIFIIILL